MFFFYIPQLLSIGFTQQKLCCTGKFAKIGLKIRIFFDLVIVYESACLVDFLIGYVGQPPLCSLLSVE
jgi:hypothetical protein